MVEGDAAFDISAVEEVGRVKSLQMMLVKKPWMNGGMRTELYRSGFSSVLLGRGLSIGLWSEIAVDAEDARAERAAGGTPMSRKLPIELRDFPCELQLSRWNWKYAMVL